MPLDRQCGGIAGLHCRLHFYLPDQGWIAIDASEASKNPAKPRLYCGTHPVDRIHFTTGRDLVVSDASEPNSLNYFIYPYLELDGKLLQGSLKTRFSYREVSAPTLAN